MKWNIESEYPSIESKEFLKDQAEFEQFCASIEAQSKQIHFENEKNVEIGKIQNLLIDYGAAQIIFQNLYAYTHCCQTVDSSNQVAKDKETTLIQLSSKFSQSSQSLQMYMAQCSDEIFEGIISNEKLIKSKFYWQQERLEKDFLLSEKEEKLVTALSPTGLHAWGQLYSSLSGAMKIKIEKNGKSEVVGLAQAAGMVKGGDEPLRKSAWQGIQAAWTEHEEAAAAILNSLAGWRLEMCKKRSEKKAIHFLDVPLLANRIQKETLEAMMTAIFRNVEPLQKANLLMAKMHGKKVLDPWDLLAPAPAAGIAKSVKIEKGLEIIRSAFSNINSEFGNFVNLMKENQWIESRVLANKRNGAYCTGFAKSRTPRVFMTYLGSASDISTLAHELGHAYHSWVMRDMDKYECFYTSSLAETASIFAETVLADELVKTAQTKEEKIEFVWGEIENATSLLLNIPARFEFEKEFYEIRKDKVLSPEDFRQLTDKVWTKWYGKTLSENDKMFWATKLHFSMSGTSFYNFPYAFGYLFSLSIYARRNEFGTDFMKKYVELLRDTGRMTAEDLVMKHLGEDIRNPEFWQKSIDVVLGKISDFEALVGGPDSYDPINADKSSKAH